MADCTLFPRLTDVKGQVNQECSAVVAFCNYCFSRQVGR